MADHWVVSDQVPEAPPQPGVYLETEKRVPLQMENFGTLMTQVSFCELNYDGDWVGWRMLASRLLAIESPLASYLNLLSQADFLLPTLKRPRSRGRESIVARHHQDSMRTVLV